MVPELFKEEKTWHRILLRVVTLLQHPFDSVNSWHECNKVRGVRNLPKKMLFGKESAFVLCKSSLSLNVISVRSIGPWKRAVGSVHAAAR